MIYNIKFYTLRVLIIKPFYFYYIYKKNKSSNLSLLVQQDDVFELHKLNV